jgi:hypothetical protein
MLKLLLGVERKTGAAPFGSFVWTWPFFLDGRKRLVHQAHVAGHWIAPQSDRNPKPHAKRQS